MLLKNPRHFRHLSQTLDLAPTSPHPAASCRLDGPRIVLAYESVMGNGRDIAAQVAYKGCWLGGSEVRVFPSSYSSHHSVIM